MDLSKHVSSGDVAPGKAVYSYTLGQHDGLKSGHKVVVTEWDADNYLFSLSDGCLYTIRDHTDSYVWLLPIGELEDFKLV